MGLGVSIFLIAVGAILTWAVNATVSGLEIQTIGVILMIVGALGLVLSMIFWSSWGGVGGGGLAGPRMSKTGRASSPRFLSPIRSSERRSQGRLSSFGYARGRSNENVEPLPGFDSTRIRPPIRRTISREM